MEHRFEHGPIRVTVETPDLPEGVKVKPEITLDAAAVSEEAVRSVIAEFGGAAAFEKPNAFNHRPAGWMYMEGATVVSDFPISIEFATGHAPQPPEPPFIRELRMAQEAARRKPEPQPQGEEAPDGQ